MSSRAALVIALGLIAVVATACSSGPKAPPDVARAVSVLSRTTTKLGLKRSAFIAIPKEERSPSRWVSFYFSDLGAAEWPPIEGSAFDEPGVPARDKLPASVALMHGDPSPDMKDRTQIVLRGDDAKWEIAIAAYRDPNAPPIYETRWPFPRW